MSRDHDDRQPHAAVVFNPIKSNIERLREAVAEAEEAVGWAPTQWFETSVDDPGQGPAEEAVRGGATVVLAAGGDGTVRAVGEGLRGSSAALAVIPLGTGNLLARNLDMPLTTTEAAVEIAFTGHDRTIDIGIAELTRENGSTEEHAFLVMAGLGLDAKMIKNTNSTLKKAVGWLAYVDGIARSLPELKPVKLRFRLDDHSERSVRAHTVIVGNCGLLPGGLLLMPDATPDDGRLHIAVLRPRGPFGWAKIWRKVAWENGVLRKSAVGRRIINLSQDVKDVTNVSGTSLRMTVEKPQEFQLDGDTFGEAASVHVWVDPGALRVRVAAELV